MAKDFKPVVITPEHVALYLAEKQRPFEKKHKQVDGTSPAKDLAKYFLQQHDVRSLFEALKHKGKNITLTWIVQEWLKMLDSKLRGSERLAILDRLRDLLLLGAIQDESLARQVGMKVKTEAGRIHDPLVGEKRPALKFRENIG